MASEAVAVRRGREIDWTAVWHYATLVGVAAMVIIPLVFLILGSFSTARLPTDFTLDQLGVRNYVKVWTDPATYRVFTNTIIYVSGATAFDSASRCIESSAVTDSSASRPRPLRLS